MLLWAALGCSGLLWTALGCFWAVLGCSGLLWAVLGCSEIALGCSGLPWAALSRSKLLWAALGCSEQHKNVLRMCTIPVMVPMRAGLVIVAWTLQLLSRQQLFCTVLTPNPSAPRQSLAAGIPTCPSITPNVRAYECMNV